VSEISEGPQPDYTAVPREYAEHLSRRGFDLTNFLGRGLSGRVFEATQSSLDRPVAVKFFDNELSVKNDGLRKRFVRESKLLARLTSPHIPYVLTTGEVPAAAGPATPYYVMEFVPGRPLETLITKGPLTEETAISVTRQVLAALTAAHQAKIVHRDVSRRNVLVHDGRCYLIDFSISGPLGAPGVTALTKAGEHLGHHEYAAPEQKIDLRQTTERTDIYATGVLLFEMLAKHTKVDVADLPRQLATTRPALREIIKHACASKPQDRYATAAEFAAALSEVFPQPRLRRTEEALALCVNTKCDGADWSPRGYYRKPRIFTAKANHCDECGGELLYQCRTCGEPFSEKPHCGNCGAKFYEIPTCVDCGSWLTRDYMDADTALGCEKCIAKRSVVTWTPKDENDVPF
jgi:serine/threonine protein kinase